MIQGESVQGGDSCASPPAADPGDPPAGRLIRELAERARASRLQQHLEQHQERRGTSLPASNSAPASPLAISPGPTTRRELLPTSHSPQDDALTGPPALTAPPSLLP